MFHPNWHWNCLDGQSRKRSRLSGVRVAQSQRWQIPDKPHDKNRPLNGEAGVLRAVRNGDTSTGFQRVAAGR